MRYRVWSAGSWTRYFTYTEPGRTAEEAIRCALVRHNPQHLGTYLHAKDHESGKITSFLTREFLHEHRLASFFELNDDD